MELIKKINRYRKVHGLRGLLRRIKQEVESIYLSVVKDTSSAPSSDLNAKNITHNGNPLSPLNTYLLHGDRQQSICIVTDSIGSSSLFGGVGTAIILGVIAANHLSANLKIITRTEPSNPKDLEIFLDLLSMELNNEVAFIFAPPSNTNIEIAYSTSDLFITTSWWTTSSVIKSVPLKQVMYLLQEDERMFYPFGDERLKCDSVLKHPDLRLLINTKLLFDHFVLDQTINPGNKAAWFEPSFPDTVYQSLAKDKTSDGKRRFFFYARPSNPRNLYEFGVNLIKQAIDVGIISVDEWDIYFVGKNIPVSPLGNRCTPIICEELDWKTYALLIRTMDLGLSLMCTPHPSYPPLDLVASGSVVVTNKFGNKISLENYSKNIVTADLNYESMLLGISKGVEISKDSAIRQSNFNSQSIRTNWKQSFASAISNLTMEP